MDDRAIGLIGLMRRAGAIEIGEDNSGSAVSAGKAKLLLTAADASENALRHAERFTQGRRVMITEGSGAASSSVTTSSVAFRS